MDDFLEAKNQYLTQREVVFINNEPTQQGCQKTCLRNCSCTAFALGISDPPIFRLWFGDLFGMNVSSKGQSVFVRLADSEIPQLISQKSSKAPAPTILLCATTSFFPILAILLAAFILLKCRRLWKRNIGEEVPVSLRKFSYKELRIATDNFKHKLGSGAFDTVFKGTLPDKTPNAVKRLEGSTPAEKQFRTEIITTGRIQHVNLVRLRGFCVDGSQRLLVYAYMPNSSLNSFLFFSPEEVEKVFNWGTQLQIALGTAQGLICLHNECSDRIIHCNIKPENILLDSNFSPKVADFGLAKLVGRDFSRVLTTTRGTRGYVAPEWISCLPITPKADVLMCVTGPKNVKLKI